MENQIDIGMKMPLNAATKTFAFLAKRGAGKSYAAAVLAEEFYKNGIPFVVFDPNDMEITSLVQHAGERSWHPEECQFYATRM